MFFQNTMFLNFTTGFYGFSTGYDGFSTGSLGFLHLVLYFSQKIRTSSIALCKDDSWIIGFYRFLCWAASMWLQNRIGNHRLIGMFEELVYLFIAPIQNYVQYVYIYIYTVYIYTLGFKYL